MNIWALALGAIIGWGCFVMPGVNFLHGKWEGVSVEKILLSKMKAETNQ